MKEIGIASYRFQVDDKAKVYRIQLIVKNKKHYFSPYFYKEICKVMKEHEAKEYRPIDLIEAADELFNRKA
ncbi:MAG: hypothetical protein ACW97O_12940 [Candidatus Thorarchaeota archaeon]|jgi:hypothetical protein